MIETRPDTVCTVCDARLHYQGTTNNEWQWVDDNNRAHHDRFPFEPYQRMNELAALMKTNPAAGEQYARLVVDVDMGGTFALHKPEHNGPWRPSGPTPADHCGEPPYYSPTGWECRSCKTAL